MLMKKSPLFSFCVHIVGEVDEYSSELPRVMSLKTKACEEYAVLVVYSSVVSYTD